MNFSEALELMKQVLDDKLIGGKLLLSNGATLYITCAEYYDLKECMMGDLECLK